MDRRDRIVQGLDLDGGRGLEIGPLHHPLVRPTQADVLYVDHATTKDLREKYRDDPAVDDITEVDVVWGDRRLVDALPDPKPVSWIVASHVIEHVPDLIGWLGQLAEVMEDGGLLSLAIPDKRYTFDAKRAVSDVGDVVDAFLTGRNRPTLGATFDFWSRITTIDLGQAWEGRLDLAAVPDNDALGLEKCGVASESEEYHDIHCWVFTPESFLEILRRVVALGLAPWFEMVRFEPTEPGSLEFYATLKKLPAGLECDERMQRQLRSLVATTAPGEKANAGSEARFMEVSAKEAALIEAKRKGILTVRQAVHRLPQLLRR
jgi:hypothetical protein